MAGLDRSRVAELIVDAGLKSARRGSGYLVSSAVVLTAAHVVRGAVSVLVRFNADRRDRGPVRRLSSLLTRHQTSG